MHFWLDLKKTVAITPQVTTHLLVAQEINVG